MLSAIIILLLALIEQGSANSCGLMSSSVGLVQGGEFSTTSQFPWITNIFTKFNGVYLHAGSGTLISDRTVICGANSVAYENYLKGRNVLNPAQNYIAYEGKDVKLLFGAERYKGFDEPNALVIESVKDVILHPDLKGTKPRTANIAILRLSSGISLTPYIQPACVWDGENNIVGDHEFNKLFAVGYGNDDSGSISIRRKHIAMTHTPNLICKRFYRKVFEKLPESADFFCARGNGNETPCKHDKALYVKVDGQWYLRAMSSMFKTFRNNTCSTKAPVLYEDLSPYSEWISQTILEW